MRSLEDVDRCVAAGADALGFIFAPGPRCLSIDEAATLTNYVPHGITRVGVFAGNDEAVVQEALRRCKIDLLQFSGEESPEFCGSFSKPTIRVVHANRPGTDLACESHPPQSRLPDLETLRVACAIAVMVDSRLGMKVGGTGVAVDRALAARLSALSPLPFVLAGGLSPDSVAPAIAAVRPWGVDVRSGVERNGAKDYDLVERFVREARRALDDVGSDIRSTTA